MSRIIIAFDPHQRLERGPLPEEIKWAQMDVGDLVNADLAEVAKSLAELFLNQLNEANYGQP